MGGRAGISACSDVGCAEFAQSDSHVLQIVIIHLNYNPQIVEIKHLTLRAYTYYRLPVNRKPSLSIKKCLVTCFLLDC
jgi:hypothetical protein